jgi:F-type H+-transporting ATPase subunit gamma
MSDRLADVEARIGTVAKLAAVIAAMRGIAASRAMEAREHTDSIRSFADTIGAAIGQSLTLLPAPPPAPDGQGNAGRRAVVLLAAEQGFAGAYTELVFDAAGDLLGTPHDLILAGSRGLLVAQERQQTVDWSAAMIAHPAQAMALATRITEAVFSRLAAARVTRVSVVHATPRGADGNAIVIKQLVPFDYTGFPAPKHGIAPQMNLPPEDLLTRLVEEYVFAELAEAVMLSFAAENEARMRAMIAAHDSVSQSLDRLTAQSRRLRQAEITEEIVELAMGCLPLR